MARGKWARADLKAGKTEVDGNPFTALRQQSTGKFMGKRSCLEPCPQLSLVTKGTRGTGQCGSFLNNGTDPIPIPGDFGKERPWTNAPSDLGYSLLREYRGTGLSIEASKVFLESYYWPMMGMRAIGLVSSTARLQIVRGFVVIDIVRHTDHLGRERGVQSCRSTTRSRAPIRI